MARPAKQTVDYFPHMCAHGKTLYILEKHYGNDGYAFWFKLLELLGKTTGHYVDTNDVPTWEFLQATMLLDEQTCVEILNMLAKLHAIDQELWDSKIIWSQNFVDNVAEVYRNRRVETPAKPSSQSENPPSAKVSTPKNPQSIVEETKEKKTKKEIPYAEIIDYLNTQTGKKFKPTSQATQKHISGRWEEGFCLDDFKKVIDDRVSEWKGDKKMEEYLRPATLFNSEKFEGYLNNVPGNKEYNCPLCKNSGILKDGRYCGCIHGRRLKGEKQ